jgi:hypothetical protein
MDGFPPSICPTGIYRPPSGPPTSADSVPQQPASTSLTTVGAFSWVRMLAQRVLGGWSAASSPLTDSQSRRVLAKDNKAGSRTAEAPRG